MSKVGGDSYKKLCHQPGVEDGIELNRTKAFLLIALLELKGSRVYTITKARFGRTIIEQMAKM